MSSLCSDPMHLHIAQNSPGNFVPLNFLAGLEAGCSTALLPCFCRLPAVDGEASAVGCLLADAEASSDTAVAIGCRLLTADFLPLVLFVTADSRMSVSAEISARPCLLGGNGLSSAVTVTGCLLLEGTGDDSASAPLFLLGVEATSTADINFVPRVFLTDGEETGGSFKSSFTTDPTSTFTFDLSVFFVPGGEDGNSTSPPTTPRFLLLT